MIHRTTAELVASLLTSMHARPCLRKQLLLDLGLPPDRTELIKVHMRALIASGWVRIAAWQGPCPMYGMQTAPFAEPDEPRPVRAVALPVAPSHRRPVAPIRPGASSVFAWGRA
jgi:hypothetical protein